MKPSMECGFHSFYRLTRSHLLKNFQAACLEFQGRSVILYFPPSHPPNDALRFYGFRLIENPWDATIEPIEHYRMHVKEYSEEFGTQMEEVGGVPALTDPAHSDESGTDAAFLTLVLQGTEIQLHGGESVEDLIAIAETLTIVNKAGLEFREPETPSPPD